MKQMIINCIGEVEDVKLWRHKFMSLSDDEAWESCNNFEQFVLDSNALLAYVYTPNEYAKMVGIKEEIPDSISVEEFDEIAGDKYCLWNYPTEETDYLKENDINVVLVEFKEDYRFCETRIEKTVMNYAR